MLSKKIIEKEIQDTKLRLESLYLNFTLGKVVLDKLYELETEVSEEPIPELDDAE